MKLLLDEDGSELADELWHSASSRFASQLAFVEARAALAAACRLKRLSTRAHRTAMRDLDKLWAELRVIGIDNEMVGVAAEMADQFALRGYDAVHLACIASMCDPTVVVATWDAALSSAAAALGVSCVPRLEP